MILLTPYYTASPVSLFYCLCIGLDRFNPLQCHWHPGKRRQQETRA